MLRKSTFFSAMLFAAAWGSQAQSSDTLSADVFFSQLDTSRISTGILMNKVLAAGPNFYHSDGVNPEAPVLNGFATLDNLWLLRQGTAGDTLIPKTLDLVDSSRSYIAREGNYPIILVDFNYNLIDSLALQDSLLSFQDSLLVDGPNLSGSPYQSHYFLNANVLDSFYANSASFVFESEFYFSNAGPIQSIEIDFGDGQGFRSVTFGVPLTPSYGDLTPNYDGKTATITVRIQRNGQWKTARFKSNLIDCNANVVVPIPSPAPWPNGNNFRYGNISTAPFDISPVVEGNAYVHYRPNPATGEENLFKKPVIIIEGFETGSFDPNKAQNFRMGDFGWCELWGGSFGILGESPLEKSPQLFSQLHNDGHDIIMLDFKNSRRSLLQNAALVRELIHRVNQYKTADAEPIILIGASAGGVMARYALAYMEQNGEDHCVNLYISLDAPHKGANISLGAQYMLEFLATNSIQPVSEAQIMYQVLNTAAAKELLIYNVFQSNKGYYPTNLRGFPAVLVDAVSQNHLNFRSVLDNMGYPNKLRKVAIASGSLTQQSQGFSGITRLYELSADFSGWNKGTFVSGKIDLEYWDSGSLWAKNNISYTAYPWFALFAPVINKSEPMRFRNVANLGSIDRVPGGNRMLAPEIRETVANISLSGFSLSIDKNTAYQRDQCFVPSISALDLNTSDYFFNITTGIANENLPTPFDAVHAPDGNNLHVEITDGALATKGNNIAFTLDAINLIAPVSNLVLNNVYNYGEENVLSHSEVINNGVLHLYGNFNDSRTAQTPSPGGKHVYKLGVGCVADNLLVKDDGEIVLGDALVNNRAELIVMKGGSLDLGANGKLKVQNGSKLVIEDGGNFSFEDGAQIELLGPDAILEIRGKVTVGDNATFTFNGNGRVIIDQFIYSGVRDNFWDIGQNASFILEGHTNYGQVLLECKSNFSPVTESNRTFKLVKIHKTKVHVHPGKHLSLTGPVDIQRVEFDLPNGMSTNNLHDGLKIWGRHNNSSWIRYNRFLHGNYGIRANQAVTNSHPLFLHGNHFENNNHGLYITGQSYTVRASTFINNNYGIYGTELHGTGQIVTSTFLNNSTAIFLSGQGGSETQISDNTIDATLLNAGFAEAYGVVLEDYAVSLKCNSFSNLHNAIRFFGDFASVELSEVKKNQFTGLNVAIYGDVSNGYFNMLNGENGFFQNISDIAIVATGTLSGPASSQNANWLDISNNRIPVQTFSPFSNVNLVSSNFTGVFNPTSNQNRAFSACSGGPGYSPINEVREIQNFNSNLWVVPPGSGGGILIDMITQAGLKITNSNEESEFLDDQQGFNELLFIANVLLNEYATLSIAEKQITNLVLRMLEKALHQLYKQEILAYNNEYDVTSIAQEISSLNAVIAQFIALQGVPTDTASHERIAALNLKMIHNLRQGGYLKQAVEILTNNFPLNVGPRMMSRWMYWDCVINTEAAFMQGLIEQDIFEMNLVECITNFAPRVSNTSVEIPEQSLEMNDFAVELYPNPSSDYLYFRTPGIEDPETPLRVSINNIFGAEVYHNSTTATFVHRIDLQNLPAGAYVLKVEALGKTKTSKFLVVR